MSNDGRSPSIFVIHAVAKKSPLFAGKLAKFIPSKQPMRDFFPVPASIIAPSDIIMAGSTVGSEFKPMGNSRANLRQF
jgi:hypothetical protein